MEKTFIVSREKFLELKKEQKRIARSRKKENKEFKDYVKYRRLFYKSKGQQVPDYVSIVEGYGKDTHYTSNDEKNGFIHSYIGRTTNNVKAEEPRYFNVIYGIVRGRSYAQIEPKVRKGNELRRDAIEKYCKKYGVDERTITEAIWQTA